MIWNGVSRARDATQEATSGLGLYSLLSYPGAALVGLLGGATSAWSPKHDRVLLAMAQRAWRAAPRFKLVMNCFFIIGGQCFILLVVGVDIGPEEGDKGWIEDVAVFANDPFVGLNYEIR